MTFILKGLATRAMKDPAFFRELRRKLKLKQEELADELGVTQSTISKWERGLYSPNMEQSEKIAELIRVKGIDLDLGSRLLLRSKRIRVAGYIGAGATVVLFDEDDMPGEWETISAPFDLPDDAIAVVVRGDSMYPKFEDGDRIFYGHSQSPADLVGKVCVVKLTDGSLCLKRLRRGSRNGSYNLESVNAPPVENVMVEWAAPILWVQPA